MIKKPLFVKGTGVFTPPTGHRIVSAKLFGGSDTEHSLSKTRESMIKKYKQAQRFRVAICESSAKQVRAAVLHGMAELLQGVNRSNNNEFNKVFKEMQEFVNASTSAIDNLDKNEELEVHFIVRKKGDSDDIE